MKHVPTYAYLQPQASKTFATSTAHGYGDKSTIHVDDHGAAGIS